MQPLSGNQRPDFLTSLMNMSCVLGLPREMHLCRSSSNVPRLPSFLDMLQNPHALLTFGKVHNPLRLPRETTSESPKVVRTPGAFNISTSKCAWRHIGVHFFDIPTSKSGPGLVCLVHFDFEMCFAPQRRSLFRHRNFQKWSGPGVFCTFLTSKCASRHNGVHFFDISTSKSCPSMVCFVHFDFDMCFSPQRRAIFHLSSGQMAPHPNLLFNPPCRATNQWKTQCFATFPPFRASASSFFWLSSDLLSSTLLFSLTLPISAFHLSILSEVWLLNFLRIVKPYLNLVILGAPSCMVPNIPCGLIQWYQAPGREQRPSHSQVPARSRVETRRGPVIRGKSITPKGYSHKQKKSWACLVAWSLQSLQSMPRSPCLCPVIAARQIESPSKLVDGFLLHVLPEMSKLQQSTKATTNIVIK